jgi:GDPmannose 4,6-dehydratase
MKTALITGINGQDGAHLAELLSGRGYRVLGLARPREESGPNPNVTVPAELEVLYADLRDEEMLRSVLKKCAPQEIYNLAARASSSQLFDQPLLTADVNGLAVVRLLEAIRTVDPTIRFCQASSSEMFGNALESPQSETTQFHPRNPYGVAKLFAHGMVGMYRAHFGLFACSAILFNHESARRGPEFVTRRITRSVALINAGFAKPLQVRSLDATRDWGFAGDYVYAMWQMLQASSPADYVIATGEIHSVREFCEIAFARVGLDYRKFVHTDPNSKYAPEAVPLVGDAAKAKSELGWSPTVSFQQLVHSMVDADIELLAREGIVNFDQFE